MHEYARMPNSEPYKFSLPDNFEERTGCALDVSSPALLVSTTYALHSFLIMTLEVL